ncbi:hypothetical protein BDF14DRAFT_1855722, partial [Spinellus fusiger]
MDLISAATSFLYLFSLSHYTLVRLCFGLILATTMIKTESNTKRTNIIDSHEIHSAKISTLDVCPSKNHQMISLSDLLPCVMVL